MRASKGGRVRRSESEWKELLVKHASSGVGVREFCRREGVSLSSMQRWQRRLGSQAQFVELQPADKPREAGWSVEIMLPNGVQLSFRG